MNEQKEILNIVKMNVTDRVGFHYDNWEQAVVFYGDGNVRVVSLDEAEEIAGNYQVEIDQADMETIIKNYDKYRTSSCLDCETKNKNKGFIRKHVSSFKDGIKNKAVSIFHRKNSKKEKAGLKKRIVQPFTLGYTIFKNGLKKDKKDNKMGTFSKIKNKVVSIFHKKDNKKEKVGLKKRIVQPFTLGYTIFKNGFTKGREKAEEESYSSRERMDEESKKAVSGQEFMTTQNADNSEPEITEIKDNKSKKEVTSSDKMSTEELVNFLNNMDSFSSENTTHTTYHR